jgi:hypothetical protein
LLTRTAPTRCCQKLAKALSRSLSVLAITTASCRPSVGAAACKFGMADWVASDAGSARRPNRAALGANSRSNCNRFGASSPDKLTIPVMFAPGRLRLATRPVATGSAPVAKTMGIVVVATFAGRAVTMPSATITPTPRAEPWRRSSGWRSGWWHDCGALGLFRGRCDGAARFRDAVDRQPIRHMMIPRSPKQMRADVDADGLL